VLLSGGLDSTTALALARAEGRECCCLTVRYGQRHAHEIEAARNVARHFGAARHMILDVDLSPIGGSALVSPEIEVPKDRDDPAGPGPIPPTYVPARNTVLLSLALAWAEVLDAREIWLGVSSVDYSGYPDCRPEFVEAFQALAAVATRAAVERGEPVRLRAPLLRATKAETIRLGLRAGANYALTHSCYDPAPDGASCGRCDACRLRLRAFAEAGVTDPVRYAERPGPRDGAT
jgi:7-cyano-7-deazaguanine synthase